MDDRQSPKNRALKVDTNRLPGKHAKASEDGPSGGKSHAQGRRVLQQPLHIRISQNKASTDGSSAARSGLPLDIPRRSRSTPSSANVLPTKQTQQQPPSPTFKSSESNSPIQVHRQTSQAQQPAKKHPTFFVQYSVPAASTQHNLDPAKQKLVDRATKARLYYLRKSGPNRFLVGGDSPDSRFNVTIGPQSCSCKKSHCVHIFFVMLRVFKLSPSDPILWRKTLQNYEAETLLTDFQTRVSQRSTPRKSSVKKVEFNESTEFVDQKTVETTPITDSPPLMVDRNGSFKSPDQIKNTGASDPGPLSESLSQDGDDVRVETSVVVTCAVGDSDKNDMEEEVCPICLNELDEGEDLLTCSGCRNQMHQHCMDVWAGEQKKKQEGVQCPVCRAPCLYNSPGAALASTPTATMPVSAPEALGVDESLTAGSSPSHPLLSKDKEILFEKLKSMFGVGSAEGLFSSNWKLREAALTHFSRESITYFLPHVTAKFQSREPSEEEEGARQVQEVCMAVVTHACNDSVLKVFLAAMELLRVTLSYSVCHNATEANKLQSLLKPVLPGLITRCADAQRRVKECSIDTVCNLCLGQDGPLCVGSSCGHQTSCGVSNVRLILQSTLHFGSEKTHSWNWWLGRVTLMDKLLARFSWEFLLPQCMSKPLSPHLSVTSDSDTDDMSSGTISGVASPYDSISSSFSMALPDTSPDAVESGQLEISLDSISLMNLETDQTQEDGFNTMSPIVKNNLLMQCWYFAAKATHVPHSKLAKVARRVIIRIAKVLRDDPSSLEVIYDVIAKCRRSSAEGLLDRVLQAREKLQESLAPRKDIPVTREEYKLSPPRKLHNPSQPLTSYRNICHVDTLARELSRELSEEENLSLTNVDVERSLKSLVTSHLHASSKRLPETVQENDNSSLPASHVEEAGKQLDAIQIGGDGSNNSEDSFCSAVSELDQTLSEEATRTRNKSSDGTEEASSSTSNSHDSRSGDQMLRSDSMASAASGRASVASTIDGNNVKKPFRPQPYYKRQSTVDSAFSSDFDSSTDIENMFPCKRNIEEEEAETLAKVRSMIPEDCPHPSLSLIPLSDDILVYVQPSVGKDEPDYSANEYKVKPYIEGIHWKKGKLIGTGAFCTCYLARDMENGTMFAVKQVSFARNTKVQEEDELKRLMDEISMLTHLGHPNIVRCLGATQQDQHVNIFVEWMAGGCLEQILTEFGPLNESVVCNYARQIIQGIVYLHENHVIHRDLKGGNILLDSTGRRIRIADFGASARLTANTTGPGEFLNMEGTVAFMAPEVVRGGSTDDTSQPIGYGRKCDVWSIGCVIIQMATAKLPWVGSYDVRNKYQLIFKIGQATAPPPLPDFNNPALKDLAIRCLEIKPSDRPTSSDLLKHPLFTERIF